MSWTNTVFDKVAEQSNLGPRTLEACRRVLVEGEVQIDVGRDMGMLSAQISRGVSGLRQRLAKMGDLSVPGLEYNQAVGAHLVETETSRDFAVRRVREMEGVDMVVRDAQPGQLYVGKPLFKTPLHLVQISSPGEAVIHDLAKLERVPNMNFPLLEVNYPANGGLASVVEVAPGQERGGRGR